MTDKRGVGTTVKQVCTKRVFTQVPRYLAEEKLGVLQHVVVVSGRGRVHPLQLGRGEEQGSQGLLRVSRVQGLVDLGDSDDAWKGYDSVSDGR